MNWRFQMLVLLAPCLVLIRVPSSWADEAPGPIDYTVRLQSNIQSDSNFLQVPSNTPNAPSGSLWSNTAGLAARIPLLSERTRLDLAAMAGDARSAQQPQLDYHPRSLDSTFHWQAGQLFDGQLEYRYRHDRSLSDRLEPLGDTVTTRHWGGDLGLRVSEDLTLPRLRLFEDRTRYGAFVNQQISDQNEHGFELTGEYHSPIGSSLSLGFRRTTTAFPLRYLPGTEDLANRYVDRELFGQVLWQYSVKTSASVRVGWLDRKYAGDVSPNVRLPTLDAELNWQYSPKTLVQFGLWQRPYVNDDQPEALYSTLRGAGLDVSWQITAKTAIGVRGTYETLRDRFLDVDDERSVRTRLGLRLSWAATRDISFVVDGYQAQQRSDQPWNRNRQNVVRVGVVMYFGSGNKAVNKLLVPRECQWSYVESDLCL